MKFCAIGVIALVSAALACPAMAHHSYAMFDADKTIDLPGTVKEVEWTNPHSWLEFMAMGKDGKVAEWSFEMGPVTGGPTGLNRQGFRAKNIQPGDKLVAKFHPLRNGRLGGELISLIFADGSILGGREPIPRGEAPSTSAKPIE